MSNFHNLSNRREHSLQIILALLALGANLAGLGSSSTANAAEMTRLEVTPAIIGTSSFPTRVRANLSSVLRHSFRLQIPAGSSAIAQIQIQVPDSLRASKDITIVNQANQAIHASVAVQGNTITLGLSQPALPGTTLKVEINLDQILYTPNVWLYPVSVKYVDQDQMIPIGMARFGNL